MHSVETALGSINPPSKLSLQLDSLVLLIVGYTTCWRPLFKTMDFWTPREHFAWHAGDDDEDLQSCVAYHHKDQAIQLKMDNFGGFIEPSSVFTKCTGIHNFFMPKINFTAKSFYKIINLNLPVHEPPATKQFSYQEINQLRLRLLKLDHPCHNQAVEQHVKLVTETSASTTSHERHDEMIRQRIQTNEVIWNKETIPCLKTSKTIWYSWVCNLIESKRPELSIMPLPSMVHF